MKSIGYIESRGVNESDVFFQFDQDMPQPGHRDLLVRVKAISVNPVDYKVRQNRQGQPGEPVVLGWDVAGIVEKVGDGCTLFAPGDEVYYAGTVTRPGANSEFHVVDERVVGRKPRSLSFAQAAALPLTSLTAWEGMFDRLAIPIGKPAGRDAILIIGGAGGVGSIAIQLARRLTGLTVIATASRPETREWCESLGAHHVVDHSQPLTEELARIGHSAVRYVFIASQARKNFAETIKLIAPQGRLCLIEDVALTLADANALKAKSVALCWELMFTRSSYETDDMIAQHRILDEVSRLVDDGLVRTTLKQELGPLDPENLRRAHAQLESGRTIGKLVLTVG